MTEDEARIICLANLKGSKNKDLLATARALQFLRTQPEYPSNAAAGRSVGVSGEMVREFLTLLRLPGHVQDLIDKRELNLEHGRRLWQLSRRRPDIVAEAADVMVGMAALDARNLVEYLLNHRHTSVEQARQQLADSRTRVVREYHVLAQLSEEQFAALQVAARRRNITTNELTAAIVGHWLKADVDS